MNIIYLKSPRTLVAWAILAVGFYTAQAQQPYFYLDKHKKKPTQKELESDYQKRNEQQEKARSLPEDSLKNQTVLQTNSQFSVQKFRLTLAAGAFHKHRQVSNPGPLIDDKSFIGWAMADPILLVGICYKHSRWISPELTYSTVVYTDGDVYNRWGNAGGATEIFRAKNFSLGNRFYLVEHLGSNRIKLSLGMAGRLSFFSNGSQRIRTGYIGTNTTTIRNVGTGDSLVFIRDRFNQQTNNISLVGDVLLEVKLFKAVEIGIGLAYVKGLNKFFYANTSYQYEGVKYKSEKSLFGTGLEPVIKISFSMHR